MVGERGEKGRVTGQKNGEKDEKTEGEGEGVGKKYREIGFFMRMKEI